MNAASARFASRRSVAPHRLGEPGPDERTIETLLTVAARVPDHGRLVPWRFILLQGEARRRIGRAIGEAFRSDQPQADAEKIAFEENRLARAPLVVAVVSRARPHVKIPEWEQVLSAGAVCTNASARRDRLGLRRLLADRMVRLRPPHPRCARACAGRAHRRLRPYRHAARSCRSIACGRSSPKSCTRF